MNRYKALLAGFAAAVGAGGIAAYNGAFSPVTPPAQLASQPVPAESATTQPTTEKSATPQAEPAKPTETATAQPATPAESTPAANESTTPAAADSNAAAPAETAAAPLAPSFDVLRVEPTGSVLIAGKSDPGSTVEILNGNDVVGKAKAEMNGDFAIVLDNPLKPGDYQLVLRSTKPDGSSANSVETATVSVPEQSDGSVLALVEEPGKPSRIITVPQAGEAKLAMTAEVPANGTVEQPKADSQTAPATNEPAQPDSAPAVAQSDNPATPVEPALPEGQAPASQSAAGSVTVEAVEVEGKRIFIAGSAGGAKTVRIYANDQLLGDAKPGEGDRFLLDIQKELAPGDYIIRAEGLAADGITVASRASVPFKNGNMDIAQSDAATSQSPATADNVGDPALAPNKNVIIRRGDTLWQISRRIYGRGVRYSTIYLANKDVAEDPNRIFPGQVFKIPEKTPEGDAADPQEIEKRLQEN